MDVNNQTSDVTSLKEDVLSRRELTEKEKIKESRLLYINLSFLVIIPFSYWIINPEMWIFTLIFAGINFLVIIFSLIFSIYGFVFAWKNVFRRKRSKISLLLLMVCFICNPLIGPSFLVKHHVFEAIFSESIHFIFNFLYPTSI